MAYLGHKIGQMNRRELMKFISSEAQEEIRENLASLLMRICEVLTTDDKMEQLIERLSDKLDRVLADNK